LFLETLDFGVFKLVADEDHAEYVVILSPFQCYGGEQPVAHELAVDGACGGASGSSPLDQMVNEEPIWDTEIVDELFDMILREGDSVVED
jgi:hypothetical protein